MKCVVLLVLCSVLGAGARAVARTVETPVSGRSVVSLLAPARGSAFAFGKAGHLLSTRTAVGKATHVRLVNADGQTESATVVATSDPAIVQLRGTWQLSALRGAGLGRQGSGVTVLPGPLQRVALTRGKLLASHGTTIGAQPGLEGSALLNARGRVIGVAHVARSSSGLMLLPVAGLRATKAEGGGGSIGFFLIILILLAVGAGVGAARLLLRSQTGRAADRSSRRSSVRDKRLTRDRTSRQSTSAAAAERDPDLDVVLHPRPVTEPFPDIQLRSRPDLSNFREASQERRPGGSSAARRKRPRDV